MAFSKTHIPTCQTDRPGFQYAIHGQFWIIAGAGLVTVLLAQSITTVPYGRAIWDFLFLLDGAYRISIGQVPHVDFISPVGPLSLYLTFAAETLLPRANPFASLHALAFLLTLPALAMLAPRFRSGAETTGALALLVVIMLVPFTLDSTHLSEISYFASYNRFASGFLFLVCLWYVLPKGRTDGPLLAYLITLLFFLKITAAAAALGIVLSAVIFGRVPPRTLLIATAGLIAAAVAINLPSGMVAGYLTDVSNMSALNRGRGVYALAQSAFRNWIVLAIVVALVIAALRTFTLTIPSPLRRPVTTIVSFVRSEVFAMDMVLLVGAALIAESQNTGGIGLVAAAAVLFHPRACSDGSRHATAALLLGAALLLPLADTTLKRTFTEAVRSREAVLTHPIEAMMPGTRVPRATAEGARIFERIAAEWLGFAREVQQNGFFLDPDPTSNASASRLAWATSAVQAAREFDRVGYRRHAHRVATLAFADPFARMLRLTPARRTTIATEIGRTIPVLTAEAARRYLADADAVFVSRCELHSDANSAIFQSVLDREFERLPLHRCWEFYRRSSSTGAKS